jgi:molybdate transport system substrate-binding protein
VKSSFWWITVLSLLLPACSPGASPAGNGPVRLTVLAAASLTGAFAEIAAAFEAENDGVEILYSFGASSQLAAQLVEGVPADVFASANWAQMEVVIAAGRIAAGSAAPFVSNRLTAIVPADNPAGIETLEDLATPGIALVLAATGVPVRQYTDEIVAAMPVDFQEGFYANLVSEEENVRQVAAKIALGEADAGIVYTSDLTPDLSGQVLQIEIPDEQNVIAAYPISLLTDSAHAETAQAFIDFVLGSDGQAILRRWGFGPPAGE